MSDSARPLGPLVLMIVGVLVALAVFWVGFMLAPAAVLLISYLALSAGERGRHQRQAEVDPPELMAHSAGSRAPYATRSHEGARDARGAWVDGLREGQQVELGQVEGRRDGQSVAAHAVGNQSKGVRA